MASNVTQLQRYALANPTSRAGDAIRPGHFRYLSPGVVVGLTVNR